MPLTFFLYIGSTFKYCQINSSSYLSKQTLNQQDSKLTADVDVQH